MQSIKVGDTLPISGQIVVEENGIDITELQDFSLWSISFEFRARLSQWAYALDVSIAPGGEFVSELASSVTAEIPPESWVEYDMRVRDEEGNVLSSKTESFFVYAPISEIP